MIPMRLHEEVGGAVGDEPAQAVAVALEVRFRGAHLAGKTVVFPCDGRGNVELDTLNESDRQDYLFARFASRLGQAEGKLIRRPAAVPRESTRR